MMIGTSSFLIELMPIVFPLLFLAGGIFTVKVEKSKIGYLLITFAVVVGFIMGVRYFYQVRNHMLLDSLAGGEIAEIQVGTMALTQNQQIELVVDALRDNRWFSANHGGWAKTLPLVIKFKDGSLQRFRVAYYLRQEGAIIEFFRGTDSSYWADGYAFCPRLPGTLNEIGICIPSQPGGSRYPIS